MADSILHSTPVRIHIYRQERDYLFRMLRVEQLRKFFSFHNPQKPLPRKAKDILASAHKARLQIKGFSDHEKRVSRKWLAANHYSEDIATGCYDPSKPVWGGMIGWERWKEKRKSYADKRKPLPQRPKVQFQTFDIEEDVV